MLSPAAVVVCALGLLGRSPSSTAPIRLIDSPPPGISPNAEAFVSRDQDVIFVITSTDAFRLARRDDVDGSRDALRKIASIIVHEEWHLRFGHDEQGAYLAQLTALAALGASASLITAVQL